MAITSAFKQFQRNLSPGRSLSDIGFGVGGMEGLPKRMETGLATAPLQRQATGTGGGGMVPGATNIMMPLANLASQAGTQQYGNPFAGATYNFPVVQPRPAVGATYNITTGAAPFDWQGYLDDLLAATRTTEEEETTTEEIPTTEEEETTTEEIPATTNGTVLFDTSDFETAGWDYTQGLPPWEKPTIPAGYSGPEPFSGWGAQAPSWLRGDVGWGTTPGSMVGRATVGPGGRLIPAQPTKGFKTALAAQPMGTSQLLNQVSPWVEGSSAVRPVGAGVGYANQGVDFSGMPSVDVLAARQAAASRGGGDGDDDDAAVKELVNKGVSKSEARGITTTINREIKTRDKNPVGPALAAIAARQANIARSKAANQAQAQAQIRQRNIDREALAGKGGRPPLSRFG